MTVLRLCCLAVLLVATSLMMNGCFVMAMYGVLEQNAEYQKLIEVPPEYNGLEGKSIAVLVDADLSVLYQHPQLVAAVCTGVSQRIVSNVPGSSVLNPQAVLAWQYRTPQWGALPYGEVADMLNVERVVYIDIFEYRLNPPGNSWIWDGMCAADIGIVERDGIDVDMFTTMFQVNASYPEVQGVGRESANQSQIQTGLLYQFVQEVGYLFYLHTRPKYPDKYREELG
ncbi:MAG: hypothetical protein ACYTJ0_13480 [Planctomycetota bacterium]|jgi:hypothetical protein